MICGTLVIFSDYRGFFICGVLVSCLLFRHSFYICRQAIQSFRDSNNGELPLLEVTVFFLIPFIFAWVFCRINIEIDGAAILTSLSIIIGLLINMLIPFFSIIDNLDRKISTQKEIDPQELSTDRDRITQYKILYSQVSFSILISMALFAITLVLKYSNKFLACAIPMNCNSILSSGAQIIRGISYYLLSLLFLCILKILISSNSLIYPKLKQAANP